MSADESNPPSEETGGLPEETGGRLQFNWWTSGAIAGLVGGIVFGIMLQMTGTILVIGGLVGSETAVAGWILHLVLSLAFGLAFAVAATREPLEPYAGAIATSGGLGVVYGVILWVVAAGVVMPLWMGAVGMAAPAIPNLSTTGLVGHLVFGVVLGVLYPVLLRTPEVAPVTGEMPT